MALGLVGEVEEVLPWDEVVGEDYVSKVQV